jgi:hypothetical protein
VLKAALVGPFVFVDEVLVDYRHHGHNTTRRHRELASSIRTVVRARQHDALVAGQRAIVDDLGYRLRANDRFAAWSAARAARVAVGERNWRKALGEFWWVLRFAPLAPVYWATHRLERRRSE